TARLSPDGEGQRVELKETLGGDEAFNVLKAIAAMRNSEGGVVLLGVSNDGTVKGIEPLLISLNIRDADGLRLYIQEKVDARISPAPMQAVRITFVKVQGRHVARLDI